MLRSAWVRSPPAGSSRRPAPRPTGRQHASRRGAARRRSWSSRRRRAAAARRWSASVSSASASSAWVAITTLSKRGGRRRSSSSSHRVRLAADSAVTRVPVRTTSSRSVTALDVAARAADHGVPGGGVAEHEEAVVAQEREQVRRRVGQRLLVAHRPDAGHDRQGVVGDEVAVERVPVEELAVGQRAAPVVVEQGQRGLLEAADARAASARTAGRAAGGAGRRCRAALRPPT